MPSNRASHSPLPAARALRPIAAATIGVAGLLALWTVAHRRAMSASAWGPPGIPSRTEGRLSARAAGGTGDAIVLLHGLISTGDVFGARYDGLASSHRLVIPDLLGFGRSLDETSVSFDVDDHLRALDDMAERTGLYDSPNWTIGAHSMGSALALEWAARHAERVRRVVCWGAPVYGSAADARDGITGSAMARLFALDTKVAAAACAVSCRHRTAAGWVSAAFEPSLPIRVARAAPLHTWPAYRGALRQFVLDVDWATLLAGCDRAGITVELIWGRDDRIGDRCAAHRLVEGTSHASMETTAHGDHRLPMTDPDRCIEHLVGRPH